MHPASTTAASGGLSAAIVVILMWLLNLVHVDMPADVAAAFGVVITAGIGYVLHRRMAEKPPASDSAPQAPAAPAPGSSAAAMILLPLLLCAGLWLSACSSLSTTTTAADGTVTQDPPQVTAFKVLCGTYSQAKAPLLVAEQLGSFDPAGQAALRESMAGADAICTGPIPTDLPSAMAKVNAAAVAVLIAVGQDQGKLPPPVQPAAPAPKT